MGDVFTLSANAFLIVRATSTLTLHAVLMFASVNLLLVFFLVRSRFIYVRHIKVLHSIYMC